MLKKRQLTDEEIEHHIDQVEGMMEYYEPPFTEQERELLRLEAKGLITTEDVLKVAKEELAADEVIRMGRKKIKK